MPVNPLSKVYFLLSWRDSVIDVKSVYYIGNYSYLVFDRHTISDGENLVLIISRKINLVDKTS